LDWLPLSLQLAKAGSICYTQGEEILGDIQGRWAICMPLVMGWWGGQFINNKSKKAVGLF
jgi:hypothetical protein